jgi:hypothetical protein
MNFSLRRTWIVIALSGVVLQSLVLPARAQTRPQSDQSSAPEPAVAEQSGNDEPKDVKSRTPDRIFGVLANYTTVEAAAQSSPITAKRAFKMAALNSFDPYVFPFVGVVAALGAGQGGTFASTMTRRWHQTAAADTGIGDFITRRYPTALADNAIGNFLTTGVLPSLLHQDPRYFELGAGSVWHRAAYAASRSVITRSRTGTPQFNVSEIGGNALAATASNAYYRSVDRSATNTLTRWGMQVMWDTLSNELKEFWPDIRRKLHHK